MQQIPKLLAVTGPTATGKTRLGVLLAQRLRGEIVSVDSMQLYRRMDIGTAKATPEEMEGVPHHMLDVAEPWDNWSVARYVQAAAACCADIFARGRLPILVGGTNLYLDSLLSGRDFAARPPEDDDLRQRLGAEYDRLGGKAFREQLRRVDPERAEKLHPGDKRRLVRAMEVWQLTGKTITCHDRETAALPPRYRCRKLALSFADRQLLYDRIDSRVLEMVDRGLFAEVEALLAEGLSPEHTALQAIGYKEAAAALRGEISREEAIEAIQRESRRYAKRQLTWLRRDKSVHWLLWDSAAPDLSAAADAQAAAWLAELRQEAAGEPAAAPLF